MPQNKNKKNYFFDSRLRWMVAGLLLAGAVWLILYIGVPDTGHTIVVYCTPELDGPITNCIEEFTHREGHDVIVITQPQNILEAHLVRTGDGDVVFAADQNFFRELKRRKIISEITDTVLSCRGPRNGRAEACIPVKVRAAILRDSRHPDAARCLLLFLSRPECISMFQYSMKKKSER